MPTSGLPTSHRLLACLVALIWGVNFLAIHASLDQFPPLFLVALRFTLLAIPTILFVPRPQVPTRWLVGYGLGFGVLQFTFLYTGMAAGMPAGLASLVLQASGPFTLVLGALLLNEHVRGRQWLGLAVAAVGMTLVGFSRAGAAQLLPYVLVLLAALGWALGNLSSRLAKPPNPLHLTLWMSVVVPLPMLALSLLLEGPTAIGDSLATSPDGRGDAGLDRAGLHGGDRHGPGLGHLDLAAGPAPGRRRGAVLDAGAGGRHGHRRPRSGRDPHRARGRRRRDRGDRRARRRAQPQGSSAEAPTRPPSYRSRRRWWAPLTRADARGQPTMPANVS